MYDFTLSIAGGTATLTNNRPTEVIGYGGPRQDDDFGYKFRLKIKGRITGVPNGEEKITVTPTANSIHDMYSNTASTTQKNNVASLSKAKILNIGELEYDDKFGRMGTVVHVANDVYAISYEGEGNDGWIQTFSASDDGLNIQGIRDW